MTDVPLWEHGLVQLLAGTVLFAFFVLVWVFAAAEHGRDQIRLAREADERRAQYQAVVDAREAAHEARIARFEAQREADQRNRRFRDLIARYELLPQWEDPQFLVNYAAAHRKDLLKNRETILDARVQLHTDETLMARLARERPEVYRRIDGATHALALAEVLEVTPAAPAADVPQLGPPPRFDHLDHLPHQSDPTFLEQYARANLTQILAARQVIIAEFYELRDHPTLSQEHPERYERAQWRIRVLAIAERIAVEAKVPQVSLPKPRLTPEEHRERTLRRRHVKILDMVAEQVLVANVRKDIRQAFERIDLPEEEREQLTADLLDRIGGDSQEEEVG